MLMSESVRKAWVAAAFALALAVSACSSNTPGTGEVGSTSAVAVRSSTSLALPSPSSSAAPTTGASVPVSPSGPTDSTATSTGELTAGHYAGTTGQGQAIKLFVSADRRSVQDVTIPSIQLTCTPGAGVYDLLTLRSVPIGADHAFQSETRQDGVFNGAPARFTYRFSGSLDPPDPTGAIKMTGTFRETISYRDTVAHECTTDDQPWSATFDDQPGQAASTAPAAGTYTGVTSQGQRVSFSVSAGPLRVQNFAISNVGLTCLPGGSGAYDHFAVATAAVDGSASFAVTKPQDGIFNQARAHFTVHVEGTFHGQAASGATRAAGTFHETVVYTDTARHTCSSNDQFWSATRST
jgi:hypothetical protein